MRTIELNVPLQSGCRNDHLVCMYRLSSVGSERGLDLVYPVVFHGGDGKKNDHQKCGLVEFNHLRWTNRESNPGPLPEGRI